MLSVTVLAPAKLNLTLDILGVTEKNYHLMDMIMQAVTLYERVEITKSNSIEVQMLNSNVPANESNTAYKAALAFFKETGLLAGAKIIVHKNVPVRAGMAGGSADAAAVIVGLNQLYGAKMTVEKMCEIGQSIGADVPFSIVGRTARVTGIGEILNPLPNCPDCFFTVCMPEFGVSTPHAFARYDLVGTNKHPNNQKAVEAINSGDLTALCREMSNALQFSSESVHNEPICKTMVENGALAALMTGSGAAVFGVFSNEELAQKAKTALQKTYSDCWVLKPANHGAHII